MKTQGLKGCLLAYWVAKAEGIIDDTVSYRVFANTRALGAWAFDSDPCMAATMMQRNKIGAAWFDEPAGVDMWVAIVKTQAGETMSMASDNLFEAVMRCRVFLAFGHEVAEVKGAKNG
jgi:hypothetical protein